MIQLRQHKIKVKFKYISEISVILLTEYAFTAAIQLFNFSHMKLNFN
jgi:hypothetical protein